MVIWVLIGLIAVAIPFILPIVSVTSMWRMRRRVRELEERLENQARTIEALADRLQRMAREQTAPPRPADANRPPIEERPPVQQPAAPVAPPRPIVPPPAPVVVPPPAPVVVPPPAAVAVPPPAPVNVPKPPNVVPPPAPAIAASTPPPKPISPPAAPIAAPPPPPRVTPPSAPPPSPAVPPPPAPESNGFDWESLIGVKLFSGIAGVALLLAAVFFLKYSVEHGWLQPPVRVAIGLVVAVGLLVLCELKAAREYPVTANALDASAIAILFATFFAAHSLWNLIPGVVAFGLLALTTAIAVVLSIRRESLFIAVLGLLGGFATPALLSTGENRPVPLFAYLLLLNLGLAWVSYRQAWPILSWLTVGLTTIYQWGWVLKFLTAGQLSLAMGIFLVFPLVAMAGLVLVRRDAVGRAQVGDAFEHTAVIAAALPLLFAAYLAAVPAYGAHPWLLLGFLLVLDLGLTAIAIALGRELVFGAAAVVTMVAMATLLSVSYAAAARIPIVAFTAAFVLLFALGPMAARRFGRPFGDVGSRAAYAAPLLMFVFPVLLRIEPAFAQPWLPLGVVFALLAALAAIAIASTQGALYFIAAFFAVAAQASWSVTHLTADTLRTGITIYLAFGVLSIAVPMAARRMRRPLEPAAGSGIVVLAELPLLLFLAAGRVAPEEL